MPQLPFQALVGALTTPPGLPPGLPPCHGGGVRQGSQQGGLSLSLRSRDEFRKMSFIRGLQL